jgi:uncharacterized protein
MSGHVNIMIPADDPQRASAFYQQVLGWGVSEPQGPGGYAFVQMGEGVTPTAAIARRGAPEQRTGIEAMIDSLDEALAKVVEFGGQVVSEKVQVPGAGWMASILDSEGNPLALWEMTPPK